MSGSSPAALSHSTRRIDRLGSDGFPAYRDFLDHQPDALVYYSLQYRAFLEDLLACHSEYWVVWQGNEIVGVLPLMWKDGRFGRVVNSLPFFGSNGGVLAADYHAEAVLIERFNTVAAASGVCSATWVSHPFRETAAPCHDFVDERIGQVTPLDFGAEKTELNFLGKLDGSVRRNIRKAESSGVRVRTDNDSFGFLEKVHTAAMKAVGGNPKPPAFFRSFRKHFGADVDYRLFVAERAERPVAALLLLYFERTVEYYIPATLPEEREHQPMAAILKTTMLEAAKSGYLRWNWGGTWLTQQGVWRFKRKWGAEDHHYRYFVKLNVPDVLNLSANALLDAYPGFYVVPFSALSGVQ